MSQSHCLVVLALNRRCNLRPNFKVERSGSADLGSAPKANGCDLYIFPKSYADFRSVNVSGFAGFQPR